MDVPVQAGAAGLALPDRRRSGPLGGWSLRLRTCLSRFRQATEAKPLASGGLQGQEATRSARPWGLPTQTDMQRQVHRHADNNRAQHAFAPVKPERTRRNGIQPCIFKR